MKEKDKIIESLFSFDEDIKTLKEKINSDEFK